MKWERLGGLCEVLSVGGTVYAVAHDSIGGWCWITGKTRGFVWTRDEAKIACEEGVDEIISQEDRCAACASFSYGECSRFSRAGRRLLVDENSWCPMYITWDDIELQQEALEEALYALEDDDTDWARHLLLGAPRSNCE